jgi:hypothetical protein
MMSYDEQKTKKDNFQYQNNGKFILEIFPQEYIDLNKELATQNHPKIQAIVAGYPPEEIDIKLAQIAAYCEVMLDGDYTLESRIQLCKVLKDKLVLLREPEGVQNIILLS